MSWSAQPVKLAQTADHIKLKLAINFFFTFWIKEFQLQPLLIDSEGMAKHSDLWEAANRQPSSTDGSNPAFDFYSSEDQKPTKFESKLRQQWWTERNLT